MILRYSFIFAALVLFPILSIAQNSYKPGYIITAHGDTLRGAIDYRDWEANPKKINFKSAAASVPEKLSAEKVKFFSAEVGHLAKYESYIGPISMDNTEINHLSVGRDTSFVVDTVFLRVLQDGSKIKLFSYTDSKKTRYFIASDFSEQPVELRCRIYISEGISSTVNETAFRGQLYNAAVKAGVITPKLKNQISRASYTNDDIVEIAAAINNISVKDISQNNPHKLKTSSVVLIILGAAAIIAFVIHDFIAVSHH